MGKTYRAALKLACGFDRSPKAMRRKKKSIEKIKKLYKSYKPYNGNKI